MKIFTTITLITVFATSANSLQAHPHDGLQPPYHESGTTFDLLPKDVQNQIIILLNDNKKKKGARTIASDISNSTLSDATEKDLSNFFPESSNKDTQVLEKQKGDGDIDRQFLKNHPDLSEDDKASFSTKFLQIENTRKKIAMDSMAELKKNTPLFLRNLDFSETEEEFAELLNKKWQNLPIKIKEMECASYIEKCGDFQETHKGERLENFDESVKNFSLRTFCNSLKRACGDMWKEEKKAE